MTKISDSADNIPSAKAMKDLIKYFQYINGIDWRFYAQPSFCTYLNVCFPSTLQLIKKNVHSVLFQSFAVAT